MDQRGARLMAKRANGEGTKIVKVPDRDLYKARYTDAGVKRRTVYGKTKGEVRQKLTEGLADRDKGLDLRRRYSELTGAFRRLVRDFR
jgi:hypothetical protein